MQTEHMDTAQPSKLACLPQELQSHNDAQVLLLLQDYVGKLSHTQRTLEATYVFFSLEFGRCRTVARSLHEHKR